LSEPCPPSSGLVTITADASCGGSGASPPRVELITTDRTDCGKTYEYIKEDRQKNSYEKLKTKDFIQNYYTNIKLRNPETFLWI